ncbi:DUF402 domain-containing protein [Massilibacterium senegalense]|uniref:DUF402 domain-containing protein n=1 Tax=Massilibacterium senegalense TaxID=1632858 RepID=UPI0007816F0E|nr:DUF402 domain-containing protein [Massilibacterium senegalense]
MSKKEKSIIRIESHKHNGEIHRIWEQTYVLHQEDGKIIGANIGTKVIEPGKREFFTIDPAICYFDQQHWFNVIGLIKEDGIHCYCNMTNAYDLQNQVLIYIDYDLDVIVAPDGSFKIVDQDEFDLHQKEMDYPGEVIKKVEEELKELLEWIRQKKGPFDPKFVPKWYKEFQGKKE